MHFFTKLRIKLSTYFHSSSRSSPVAKKIFSKFLTILSLPRMTLSFNYTLLNYFVSLALFFQLILISTINTVTAHKKSCHGQSIGPNWYIIYKRVYNESGKNICQYYLFQKSSNKNVTVTSRLVITSSNNCCTKILLTA